MKEPKVDVGILFEPQIEFVLLSCYTVNGKEVSGKQIANYQNGYIEWCGELYKELLFEAKNNGEQLFELLNVTIGISFHWERKENQQFQGDFKIIIENQQLTGINIVPVEKYLASVISSEMSATASLELLKAHAVISRSWLLANIAKGNLPQKISKDKDEGLIWYDREAHTHFHVCADDHCQRYQGITRASTDIVRQAIQETRGEVLTFGKEICDARFSKCCGGVLEEFPTCWEDTDYPYLQRRGDKKASTEIPDLRNEAEAEKWTMSSPEAFCNTADKHTLSQVLNNYDQETLHFYRWKVEYMQEELSEIIHKKSGIDYGEIIDLIPIKRGTSARLYQLKVVGSKQSRIIGKELEIRRILSPTHLYSSAFIVEKQDIKDGVAQKFVLRGAGWGHGVGLCQIGAAVMGEKGYAYNDILLHYYNGAQIEKMYL